MNSLFTQAMSSWNNNYSLQLEINNSQDGVLFGFVENERYNFNCEKLKNDSEPIKKINYM